MDGLAVGRIVHYVALTGAHRAAIIAEVDPNLSQHNGMITIAVFEPSTSESNYTQGGVQFRYGVSYSEEPRTNTWHWPERV